MIDLRTAIELLFAPGFSTSETTNDISGRGVGMDAVRAKIRQLGGEVIIDSTPGTGTAAQIRLPLTLAIVSGLQVEMGGAPFAFPIDRIERTLRLGRRRPCVRSRGVACWCSTTTCCRSSTAPRRSGARQPTGDPEFAVVIRGRTVRLALDRRRSRRPARARHAPTATDRRRASIPCPAAPRFPTRGSL